MYITITNNPGVYKSIIIQYNLNSNNYIHKNKKKKILSPPPHRRRVDLHAHFPVFPYIISQKKI